MSRRDKQRHGPRIEAVTDGQFDEGFFRRFLATHQNQDGGWGYFPHAPSSVEATSWALIALGQRQEDAPAGDALERGREWLVKVQLKDGSWPPFPGLAVGCWVTSLAALTLHRAGTFQDAVARGRDWLLAERPAEGSLRWRLGHIWSGRRVVRQDNSLLGWSWTPRAASWVEPTAHALLFLQNLPALPSKAIKRRRLAEAMLLDRRCPGGGWNNGNPLVYGVAGIPSVGPTCWALLALAHSAHVPELQSSLNWLEGAYRDVKGAASLALAHRCLRACGREVSSLIPDIINFYPRNRFFDSTVTIAWLKLALAEGQKPSGEVSMKDATREPR